MPGQEVTDQQDSIVSTGTVSDNTTNYTNTNFTWRALTKGDNKNIILYIITFFANAIIESLLLRIAS